jgi:hypothetical protein
MEKLAGALLSRESPPVERDLQFPQKDPPERGEERLKQGIADGGQGLGKTQRNEAKAKPNKQDGTKLL